MTEHIGFREVDADEAFALYHMCGVHPHMTDAFTANPEKFADFWLHRKGAIRAHWKQNENHDERYWVKENDDAPSDG